ncbi:MAG: NUDIX domain-containing protein [Planctomycetota bacterium]
MAPTIQSNYVDVYVLRRARPDAFEFLQLRRTAQRLHGTWQTVMGRIEQGETATDAAWRELGEETGLVRAACLGAWSLDGVHPFFIAERDTVYLMPRFAIEAPIDWRPMLNDEHDAHRWVTLAEVGSHFMWPSQLAAIREITESLLRPGSLSEPHLRLKSPRDTD